MPTYAYRCDKCGVRFDRVQSFSARPLTHCPECAGHVRRLIQPAGIVFKGSGWYVTESRKKDKGAVKSE
jgi:putative FmdB family regulatory protein